MIAIGRYLLLITLFTRMALSDERFSDDDINKFLDYIFRLHNAVRHKHNVSELKRTEDMDIIAHQYMQVLLEDGDFYNEPYGIIYNSKTYSDDTDLSPTEAISFFSLWYEEGNFLNYVRHPNYMFAVNFKQIVWRDTKEIGLAFWFDEHKYNVLVVYNPEGNIYSSIMLNVLPPRSDRRARDPDIPELFYETETEKFLNDIVRFHDKARTKHGVEKLIRDIALDECARIALDDYTPRKKLMCHNCGMNYIEIAYDNNTILDKAMASLVFSKWYNTRKYYKCKEPENNKSDPFTQIVWKSTKSFGMAIDMTSNDYRILVYYKPRGNIPGEYKSNVIIPEGMKQGESSGNK